MAAADPNCTICDGTGHIFGHTATCTRGDFCALAGAPYDCDGELYPCSCTWSSSDPSGVDALDSFPELSDDIPF